MRKSIGCVTDLLQKVEREDGKLGEQGVDGILHLKIANVLLDYLSGTLAVVTDDGKTSKFGTGFLTQIDRALARAWDVEVWSWSKSVITSTKNTTMTRPRTLSSSC